VGFGFAYDTAEQCTGGPAPGAVALRDAVRGRWPDLTDMGIYNCRNVAGTRTLSTHAEGRAIDLGTPNGDAIEAGHEAAAWLVANAEALGVQEVIFTRRRWDSRVRVWAPFGGNPHTDHVHTALCRAAAGTGDLLAGVAGATDTSGGVNVLTSGGTWVRVLRAVVGLVLVALAVVALRAGR
jgi:hypothetical protein